MKKCVHPLLLSAFFLLIFLFSIAHDSFGQKIPQPATPPRLVNDFAGVLNPAQNRKLEQKLRFYNDSTSTELAIVSLTSLQGYDMMDYAIRIFETWKIGKANKDNGILIAFSPKDRQAAIVTGYGMEGVITDAATASIRANYIVPYFRNNDYYGGLNAASDVIFKLASGEFKAEEVAAQGTGSGGWPFIIILLIIIFIGIMGRGNQNRMRKNHYGGRGIDPLTAALLLGSMNRSASGKYGDFSRGGGSFGGFGGFGGGMTGGGGSAGSW
ncbi:MAG: TPM domain-containing protein [Cyclobacteriaceae bacterium]|nr:TPM domain-containing protein [Cyclobacteriaceae bacterium]MCH8517177.1 TPM domain-containing protein [Cyclobacteriaceae bacterium]